MGIELYADNYFFLSTLKILFHCLLASVVALEKSAICLIVVPFVSNLYFLSVLRYFPKILIKLIILFSLFLELCYFPSPLDVFISSIYSLPLILILYFYIFQAFMLHVSFNNYSSWETSLILQFLASMEGLLCNELSIVFFLHLIEILGQDKNVPCHFPLRSDGSFSFPFSVGLGQFWFCEEKQCQSLTFLSLGFFLYR